jgi:hypothetical protein
MGLIHTAPAGHPRIEGQHKDVTPGSPVALLACYQQIIQSRFSVDAGLPWVYADNLTPTNTETGQPGAPRKLMVASMYNPAVEKRNYRPAIVVGHGDIQPRQVVIGNVAGRHLPTDMIGYYTQQNVMIDIEVISDVRGECASLADAVWAYLCANRQLIRELCGFRDMSLPFLGVPQPNDRGTKEFVAHVRQEIEVVFRWRTMPIAPKLREAIVQILDTDTGTTVEVNVRPPTETVP